MGATGELEWDDRLQDSETLSAGLSRSSGDAIRERTAPNPDDTASSTGLRRGNGGVGLDMIPYTRTARPHRTGWLGLRRRASAKSAPDQELLENAPYPVFLSYEVSFAETQI